MRRGVVIALAAGAAIAAAAPGGAQERRGRDEHTFVWRERLPSGSAFRVFDFAGAITVTAADGDEVEVRAEKRVRDPGDERDIDFQVLRTGGGVTICAMWRETTRCDEDGISTHGNTRGAGVTMSIRVPRGVRLRAATGNGEVAVLNAGTDVSATTGNGRVSVRGTTGPVRAASGNGSIEVTDARGPVHASTGNGRIYVVTSTGPVSASTGNGNIDVTMDGLDGDEEMSFVTGNGAVRVLAPANLSAELETSQGHGELRSDFPMTVRGRLNPSHIRATIGDGGRRIRMISGNGDLELRRR